LRVFVAAATMTAAMIEAMKRKTPNTAPVKKSADIGFTFLVIVAP